MRLPWYDSPTIPSSLSVDLTVATVATVALKFTVYGVTP